MMRAVSDSGHRGRDTRGHDTGGLVTDSRVIGHRRADSRRSRDQRPGEALITGGFSSLGGRGNPYAPRPAKRREAARVAAPLAVPVALGVTLGVILAVSSGPTKAHVTQGNSGTTTSSSASVTPGPKAP